MTEWGALPPKPVGQMKDSFPGVVNRNLPDRKPLQSSLRVRSAFRI